jgi:16S rRNA (guanine966-N2)-methyltransferase
MRIVGGVWAGKSLESPGGRVRPTAEEVRGPWLTSLEDELDGARVLDLFAGTGALGLEALSRGAERCDFVENGAPALHALKANVARMRIRDRTRIFRKDALAFASAAEEGAYDIAFADPPYASRQLDRLVEIWLERPFSRVLSVEHAADHPLPGRPELRRFGDTHVSTYRIER